MPDTPLRHWKPFRRLAACVILLVSVGMPAGNTLLARSAAPDEDLPPCEFVSVAAGEDHSLGLLDDGTVWGWGANEAGQLGDGSNLSRLQPTPVTGLSLPVSSIAAGHRHSLAVLSDGSVWCWGRNDAGQLGNGTNLPSSVPVPVTGLPEDALAVSAGASHSMALLSDGTAWTWGRNTEGQLGDGGSMPSNVPVQVVDLPEDVIAVAAGAYHSLALLVDGTMRAWGWNNQGQLGDGTFLNSEHPVTVTGLPTDGVVIAAGELHTLAVLADGTVWAWGWNSDGQLGDGSNPFSNVPLEVLGLPVDARLVAGGTNHSLAILVDGTSWSWGRNSDGQLGDGSNSSSAVPVEVMGLPTETSVLAGGAQHSLAVLIDGRAWAWGGNGEGQLGTGEPDGSVVPLPVACDEPTCLSDADCDDGVSCSIDTCDPVTMDCTFELDETACDDGDPCTLDTCDPTVGCQHELPPNRQPLADSGPDREACSEDAELVLDGSASSDPDEPCDALVAWDWDTDGDGLFDDASGELTAVPMPAAGAHGVALRVTDEHGATDVDAFVVTVVECNRAPVASAGEPQDIECSGAVTGVELDGTASFDPDGDPLTWSWSTDCPGGSFDPASAATSTPLLLLDGPPPCPLSCSVFLTVSDGDLSDDSATTVTVSDTTPPSFAEALPPDAEVECDGVPPAATLSATDACNEATVTFSEQSEEGACPSESTLTRTWIATDSCGLTTTHVQVVEVRDTTPPSFLEALPGDLTVECGSEPAAAMLTATDACGPATVTFNEEAMAGACPSESTLTRTWIATDSCGLTTTHVQVVEVRDTTPPSFLEALPGDLTVECGSEPAAAVLTATDACGPPTVAYNEEAMAGACPSESTLTRTWVATDSCGLTTTHVQVVEVRDTTPPSFLEALPGDLTVECGSEPAAAVLTATDACGPPTVAYNEEAMAGACPSESTLTRTWVATDACGLTTTHVQVVEVRDTTPPSFVEPLPTDLTVECGAVPAAAALSAVDNCGEATVAFQQTRVDGDCPGRYTLTRTWTATDACGLSTSHVQVLNVDDTTAPIVAESAELVRCLWPPNHRGWTFVLGELDLVATEDCSEPLTWRIAGCSSSQPDDDRGDGHTSIDCRVAADGSSVEVRAERQGGDQAGRTYSVLATATDACGNESAAASVGSFHVPHDQRGEGCR